MDVIIYPLVYGTLLARFVCLSFSYLYSKQNKRIGQGIADHLSYDGYVPPSYVAKAGEYLGRDKVHLGLQLH